MTFKNHVKQKMNVNMPLDHAMTGHVVGELRHYAQDILMIILNVLGVIKRNVLNYPGIILVQI